MRSILVFADRGDAMASRLETALSLARVSSGHVSVVVDTPVARFMAMDAMGGSYLAADAIREALERDDAYAEELAAHLRREDVPFDVLRCEDEPADALVEAARLSDVIVLSRGCEFAGQVAVTARAPVLLVRDDQPLSMPVDRACVGWDGGEEAAAALRVAVPLLAVITLLISKRAVMGEHIGSRSQVWLGWITTAVMGVAAAGMLLPA